jgi:hypothetical protein
MIDLNDMGEDSFFAIQAADLRWLYDWWAWPMKSPDKSL